MKITRTDIVGSNGNDGLHYLELEILEAIGEGQLQLNDLCAKLNADRKNVEPILKELKVEGLVYKLVDGYWKRSLRHREFGGYSE